MTKLIWHSNAAWAPTGYGQQTAIFAPRIAEHYDLYLSANYGLEGAPIVWQGIPVLPGLGQTHGNEAIPGHVTAIFDKPRDGLVVTLYDAQVFDPSIFKRLNVACWTPVDCEPPPPKLITFFRSSQAIPLAMSRFGQEELGEFDPIYVPHGCFDYDAQVSVRPGYRMKLGDIVTDPRASVETVVGVDADGQLTPTRILERHVLPLRDSHALRVTTESGRTMVITRDNEVMTRDGWKAAGGLKLTDYVCTLDVELFNGARAELETGRDRQVAGALSDRAKGRLAGDVSRAQFGGGEGTGWTLGTSTYWWGELREAITTAARTLRSRVGLHRRDHRWRGPHHDHSVPAEGRAVPALHTPGRDQQPIRGFDRVDERPPDLDDEGDTTRDERLGVGISASGGWSRGGRVAASASAVSSDKETASGIGDPVLLDALLGSGTAVISRGDWRSRTSSRLESPPAGSYERVVAIEATHPTSVYDLTTDTGNFLVDGVLVHNCDTEVYKPTPSDVRERMGVPKDAFLIGMVAANKGRPSRKCFQQALEAVRYLRQRHEDVYVYVHTTLAPEYAGGEDIPALAASLEIPEEHFRYPNQYAMMFSPMPSTTMAQLYSSFDVLLNVSMGEGFGIPIIEAQACGVPAIVTEFSAMTEVCGAGWKVSGRSYWTGQHSWMAVPNVEEILEALDECYSLTEGKKRALSIQARQHAKGYDARKVFDEHMLPALQEVEERIGNQAPLKVAA